MSDLLRDAKQLLSTITPGEWEAVQMTNYLEPTGFWSVRPITEQDALMTGGDAAFIAAAPRLVQALVARVQELTGVLKATVLSRVRTCGLDAALASTGWQPIETAPMDGTDVLLCEFHNGQFGHIEHGVWAFIEHSDWDGAPIYGWATDFGKINEPTHWMPALPPPPVEQEQP